MKIALVVNKTVPQALDAAYAITAYLSSQGIESEILPGIYTEKHTLEYDRGIVGGCDYVISLGGDGTTLHAAHLIGYREIPLVSFNFGHFGFLSSTDAKEFIPHIVTVLAGEVAPSRCGTLAVTLGYTDGHEEEFFAFNEVAVTRGGSGHIINLAVSINGVKITTLRGDGVLSATATGSTGYALSVGGPIVAPGHMGQVVVPIAPHTLVSRPIVTGPSDVVEVEVVEESDHVDDHDGAFFIDGYRISKGTPVRFMTQRGPGDILLVRFNGNDFYRTVERSFFRR